MRLLNRRFHRFVANGHAPAGLHGNLRHGERFGYLNRADAVIMYREPLAVDAVNFLGLMYLYPFYKFTQHIFGQLLRPCVLADGGYSTNRRRWISGNS